MIVKSAARVLFAAVVPSILITVLGLSGVAVAAAPAVTCGATLKSNATLTRDLSCPNGNGITLYRGVTLNLGGHKLVGPGTSGNGVTLSYKGGSSVINGRITNWQYGVIEDGSNNRDANPAPGNLKNVTLTNAPVDFYLLDGTIANSTFVNSSVHFMYGDMTVTASKFTTSSISGSQGLVTVSGSTVTGGSVNSVDSRGVDIRNSTLDGTGYDGSFTGCFESPVVISNSTVKNYSQAFVPSSCTVSLSGNSFSNNPDGVLRFYAVDSANGGATVTNNTFTTSGIAIEAIDRLTVSGNTFTANTTGVYIRNPLDLFGDSSDTDTVITGNTFTRNSSSGIRSLATALTVGNNTATNNGRYGIYAPQANDLGGNVAAGNKLGNCVGLTCAAK